MNIRIDVDSFRRDMLAFADRKTDALRKAMEMNCLDVERAAREKCPKNTNDLRQSITSDVKESGARFVGVVGTHLDYGVYVHEGTGVHSPLGRKDVPWYVPEWEIEPNGSKPTYQGRVQIAYGKNGKRYYMTDGIEPTPFLKDAYDENKDRIFKRFIEALRG